MPDGDSGPRGSSLRPGVRDALRRAADRVLGNDALWGAVFVVAVMLALGGERCGVRYGRLSVGDRAPYDITAQAAFEAPISDGGDEDARRAARAAVPSVWRHDTEAGRHLVARLRQLFDDGRAAVATARAAGDEPAPALAAALGPRVPPETLAVLLARDLDRALEHELAAALSLALSGRVVSSRLVLEREARITLLDAPGQRRHAVQDYTEFNDVDQAREIVRRDVAQRLELPSEHERRLGDLAASYVDANVRFDPEATERLRQEAEGRLHSGLRRVRRGEVLVHRGERLTVQSAALVAAAREALASRRAPAEWLGRLLPAALLAFFLHRYARYHQRAYRKIAHLPALLFLVLLGMLTLSAALLWVATRVASSLDFPFDQVESYAYLVPVGAGAILVALLANGRIATVYAAFAAVLFGVASGWDAYLILWALLVQCAGVYAISTYRDRAALLRAGLVVGGAGALTALALETLRNPLEPVWSTLWPGALAFVGGAVGVGLLVSFTLPMLEWLFKVLTDIRLLELSNVNRPLLAEFAVKAPGSYNHSLVVGTLAEEAARAIGANSLFCRVAAFYHDIGKMNQPEYYVENQRGENPHDRLSPSMSALILAAHVKDGVRLARQAGLPEQIVDIIPQHHGTRLMSYFYEKARRGAAAPLDAAEASGFRYPGPKPQTREAAIFMLADAVEAAARTVEVPTPERLRGVIRQLTQTIVVEGELDACDLTFADLERIQAAFLRCLTSVYHQRVDYPGFDFSGPGGRPGAAQGPRAEPPTA